MRSSAISGNPTASTSASAQGCTVKSTNGRDLFFVAGAQTEIMTEKNIQGAPAIVVEVLSKSLPRFRLLITSC
jgi:hypothetical protein